ncbi:MAG: EamA family transporter [Ramlibacter sp.]
MSALLAALLFGASTPLAKLLLIDIGPWMLAALLYLGSGLGLALYRRGAQVQPVNLQSGEARWLAAAVASGGVVGPVLLMWGLSAMPATNASLLLNLESVLTVLLAWGVFGENLGRRIAIGMVAIVTGGLVLAWPSTDAGRLLHWDAVWPTMAVTGACLAWAIDNNLTRKVALADASFIAMVKGLAAGTTNLGLALALGVAWPGLGTAAAAGLLGLLGYGASLVLFVAALRHLGAARTGAYFGVAPFLGAALAIALLGEPISWPLVVSAVLMGSGVWLHVTENHAHLHRHDSVTHAHEHSHAEDDEHHRHSHDANAPEGLRHTHAHHHEPLEHQHPHFPDAHHRHRH